MAVNDIVMSAAGASGPATFVEDIFSTFLYTGNGSTQTITNGIDLSSKGGLVWVKDRITALGHCLFDTSNGATKFLTSNNTSSIATYSDTLTSFNSNGFSLGADSSTYRVNGSGETYASWSFRKQPKFFDIVTWTGNGIPNRQIAHSLGTTPGCMIVKSTNNAFNWAVWHRGANGGDSYAYLNLTNGFNNNGKAFWGTNAYTGTYVAPTDTNFTVTDQDEVNASGATYVAYLFAHNAGGFGATGTDNVISCGSYTGNGSTTGPVINLGYEPQWILTKRASDISNWVIFDNMRGIATGGIDPVLFANSSGAEDLTNNYISLLSTGFQITASSSAVNTNGNTYIYIAIRRPMKTPTTGTEVFDVQAYTGNSSSNTSTRTLSLNISPDATLTLNRVAGNQMPNIYDKLRGNGLALWTAGTFAEPTTPNTWGITQGQNSVLFTGRWNDWGTFNNASDNHVGYYFRRAAGFFDEVCYTGGTANIPTTVTISGQTFGRVTHNLGVTPELIIIKSRTGATNWIVGSSLLGQSTFGKNALLNLTNAAVEGGFLPLYSEQTASYITVNNNVLETGLSGTTYVAYLFATVAGVSKVGSYTGTGATLNINAGFTTGARFVMIKRTDSTGNWFVWDTARGMVSGTDPRLAMNSTAAESNNDWVYTASSGFQIVTTDASVNASGGTYIYLAIA